MVLKLGSKSEDVKILQRFLKLKDDGSFGSKTEFAVKKWQKENKLKDDGVVGHKTWVAMGLDQLVTTDNSERLNESTNGLVIEQYFLPKGEYLVGPTNKEYVFLHHTAGGHNPYQVADMWGRDTRGKIATEFILGGQSAADNNTKFDGKLIQCMPNGSYGWHLGDNGSQHMHSHSVGIEVCNFGYVVNGKTYANTIVDKSQIVTLSQILPQAILVPVRLVALVLLVLVL
jgi:hypothetical protein